MDTSKVPSRARGPRLPSALLVPKRRPIEREEEEEIDRRIGGRGRGRGKGFDLGRAAAEGSPFCALAFVDRKGKIEWNHNSNVTAIIVIRRTRPVQPGP